MASLFPEAQSYPANSRSDVGAAGTQVSPSSPAVGDNDGVVSNDRLGATTKHSSIPSPESFHGASPSENPHLADGRCARAHTSDVSGGSKQAGQNQDVHDQPRNGAATGVNDGPIASEHLSRVANPNHDVRTPPVASGSDGGENGLIDQQDDECLHPRGKDSSEVERSSKKDSRQIRLEEENSRFVNKIHVEMLELLVLE